VRLCRWSRSARTVRDVAESLGVNQQSIRNWVKQQQLDRHERDDGLTTGSVRSCVSCAAGSGRLSRSAICSNEQRPSSLGRPRSGDCVSDDRGGEGPRIPRLPRMRTARCEPDRVLAVGAPSALIARAERRVADGEDPGDPYRQPGCLWRPAEPRGAADGPRHLCWQEACCAAHAPGRDLRACHQETRAHNDPGARRSRR
jgi:hypothetical protein